MISLIKKLTIRAVLHFVIVGAQNENVCFCQRAVAMISFLMNAKEFTTPAMSKLYFVGNTSLTTVKFFLFLTFQPCSVSLVRFNLRLSLPSQVI